MYKYFTKNQLFVSRLCRDFSFLFPFRKILVAMSIEFKIQRSEDEIATYAVPAKAVNLSSVLKEMVQEAEGEIETIINLPNHANFNHAVMSIVEAYLVYYSDNPVPSIAPGPISGQSTLKQELDEFMYSHLSSQPIAVLEQLRHTASYFDLVYLGHTCDVAVAFYIMNNQRAALQHLHDSKVTLVSNEEATKDIPIL